MTMSKKDLNKAKKIIRKLMRRSFYNVCTQAEYIDIVRLKLIMIGFKAVPMDIIGFVQYLRRYGFIGKVKRLQKRKGK